MSEKLAYTIATEYDTDEAVIGFRYTLDDPDEPDPVWSQLFDTRAEAEATVLKSLEEALAEAVNSMLFGEQS